MQTLVIVWYNDVFYFAHIALSPLVGEHADQGLFELLVM